MNEPEPHMTGDKGPSGRLWDATRKFWQTAAFRTSVVKRMAQKKIDRTALQRKIAQTQSELGKRIDQNHSRHEENLLGQPDIQELFHRLDDLKRETELLDEEMAAIRAETLPATEAQGPKLH